jgi:hypothetical protein
MRRDAQRRFASIVSHGAPKLLLASFTFRSWRRDGRRSFSNVVSCGIRRLTCAKYGVFWRWFSNVVSDSTPRIIYNKYGVLWGLRDERRSDTRRRFSYVVCSGIPRLSCAKYGVLLRRRDDWSRNTGRQFSNIVSSVIRGSPALNVTSFGGVTTTGVATLGVGFPTSCPHASWDSFVPFLASCVGFATLGSDFPA